MNYASVIVTFNRKKILPQAIDSVLNQTVSPGKVIVVDNASTDGTDTLMKDKYNDNQKVEYIRLSENCGGSAGFYSGLQAAIKENVDWISVSDDDAIYEKDYFEKIAKQIKENPDVKAFAGTVYNNGEIETFHRRRIKNWNILSEKLVPENEYQHNFYFDLVTFVGGVFNKELIKKIGLPEKDYFIWCDDTEYSLRIRKYTKILNVSDAKIFHKVNSSKVQGWQPNWREYYGMRNKIQMIKKHSKSPVLAEVYIYCIFIKKMVGNTVRRNRKGYRRYMYHVFIDGFNDGIHNRLGKNDRYLPSVKIEKD